MSEPLTKSVGAKTGSPTWLDHLGLSTFVAVDVETTGLDPAQHQIIEIGAIRFDGGVASAEFRTFLRANKPLDHFITELAGIRDEDLVGAPAFEDVAEELRSFLGEVPLVGQNVEFDLGFFRAAGSVMSAGGQDHPFLFTGTPVVDTSMLARIFWPELTGFSLSSLARAFGVTQNSAHRALDDARTCGEVLAREIGHLPDRVWNELADDLDRLLAGTTHRSRFLFAALAEIAEDIQKPEVPPTIEAASAEATDLSSESMETLLGSEGRFAKRLPFFDFRSAQVEMAEAAEDAFENKRILLVEAPTGIGKSLAYLVPALRWAVADPEAARQVIVSSHTKILQEQLCRKDIADVRSAVGSGFRAAVLKGRNNYLCKRRLKLLQREAASRLTDYDRIQLMPLLRWSELTATGDISEINGFSPKRNANLWAQVASDALACAGSACSSAKGDFHRLAQENAAKAHVVFVNHALLASDPARFTTGGSRRFVLDEAHQLERAMVGAMTVEISPAVVRNILGRLADDRSSRGLLHSLTSKRGRSRDGLTRQVTPLLDQVHALYGSVRQTFAVLADHLARMIDEANRSGKLRFRRGQRLHSDIALTLAPLVIEWQNLAGSLHGLYRELADLKGDEKVRADTLFELKSACDSVDTLMQQLSHVLSEEDSNFVSWVEFGRSSHGNWCSLNAAPISVGRMMEQAFWPAVEGAVLTSATLAVAGTFDSLRDSLGLNALPAERKQELVLGSPFQLERQMRAFIPAYLPDPRRSDAGHSAGVIELVSAIVERYQRGTLVLCTSNDLADRIAQAIAPAMRRLKRTLLSQVSANSLPELVNEFRRRKDAVLVGASSLWEGIDVVGEALQILIVTKLPFDVPSDPWIAARCERIQNDGHDPFAEFSLPTATLRLKQGVGRLIRHPEDRGVVILADPRLVTSRYGRVIRDSLPVPVRRFDDPDELFGEMQSFFEGRVS